jgi:hypothetical protein
MSNERYARLLRAQTSADQAVRHTENLVEHLASLADALDRLYGDGCALDATRDLQNWVQDALDSEDDR